MSSIRAGGSLFGVGRCVVCLAKLVAGMFYSIAGWCGASSGMGLSQRL